MKLSLSTLPYILVAVFLILGLVGTYIDNCLDKECCQSYAAQISGSKTCADFTYYGERPLSIEMIVLGLFIAIATFLLRK